MAKKYTSTVQVKCWKEHECVACGGTYSYLLERKASGTGSNPQKAQEQMQQSVRNIIQNDNDMQPCPTCGLYQPDMIGRRRAKKRMLILVLATIAMIIVLILRASYAFNADVVAWIAGVVCAIAASAHFMIEMHNPNRDLMNNQRIGQERVGQGKVRSTPGSANARPDDVATPGRSMLHWVALLLLAAAVVGAVSPELLRTARKWPLNKECYPPVVGPADSTRIYFPNSISSVKEYWRGWPTGTLEYNGKKTELTATTNQNDWGSTINVKSEEKSTTSHPYVDVTLPDAPELANKRVKCNLFLKLQYPQIDNSGSHFNVVDSSMQYSLGLELAPVGAGTQYNSLWWGGVGGATAAIFFASLLLYLRANSLSRQAKPTKVFQPQ